MLDYEPVFCDFSFLSEPTIMVVHGMATAEQITELKDRYAYGRVVDVFCSNEVSEGHCAMHSTETDISKLYDRVWQHHYAEYWIDKKEK